MRSPIDPALISTYSVERFIPALFGQIEVDANTISTGPYGDSGPALIDGHATLAFLVCGAGVALNPCLDAERFSKLEAESNKAEREAAAAWRREFATELADHQQLRADLEYGAERVFDRAQLNGRQRDVARLLLGSPGMRPLTPAESAQALGWDVTEVLDVWKTAVSAIKTSEVERAA